MRQGFWNDQDNRRKAVLKLIEDSGKNPADLTFKDYRKAGLGGLLSHFRKSPDPPLWSILNDVGFSVPKSATAHTPFGTRGYWKGKCGHIVRSLFERDVHDLIHPIPHDSSQKYPDETRLTCDIVVPAHEEGGRDLWIEAAGMIGASDDGSSYDAEYTSRLERKKKIAESKGLTLIIVEPGDLLDSRKIKIKLGPLQSYSSLSGERETQILKIVKTWQIIRERRREGFWSRDVVLGLLRKRAADGLPMTSRAVELDDPCLYVYARKFFGQYGCAFEEATGQVYSAIAKRRRGQFSALASGGQKFCVTCKSEKPVAAFCRYARSKDGLFYRCRECDQGYSKNRKR